MNTQIHPTAIVADTAKIAEGVSIGPYSIIGPHVVLKENVKVHSHVVIEGHTTVGAHSVIYPFAVLGMPPQNMHYKDESSTLEIGEGCTIREHVTIHPGTEKGGMRTVVGSKCYLMINVHIGHDCHVGNNVVMANGATLGGHVIVGDCANIGGLAAIHQFVRIGAYAMISGTAGVKEDVIPFGMVRALQGMLGGLNIIGMKRRGFERQDIHDLRNAFKLLSKDQSGTLEERVNKIQDLYGNCRTVKELLSFIRENPDRPLSLPSETWEYDGDGAESHDKQAANA